MEVLVCEGKDEASQNVMLMIFEKSPQSLGRTSSSSGLLGRTKGTIRHLNTTQLF